jgi:hypothetical protein
VRFPHGRPGLRGCDEDAAGDLEPINEPFRAKPAPMAAASALPRKVPPSSTATPTAAPEPQRGAVLARASADRARVTSPDNRRVTVFSHRKSERRFVGARNASETGEEVETMEIMLFEMAIGKPDISKSPWRVSWMLESTMDIEFVDEEPETVTSPGTHSKTPRRMVTLARRCRTRAKTSSGQSKPPVLRIDVM